MTTMMMVVAHFLFGWLVGCLSMTSACDFSSTISILLDPFPFL